MNLEEYRVFFVAASLALILVATIPVISLVVSLDKRGDPFSELRLLGSTHMAEGYPFNVTIGKTEQIFIGVANNMGYSAYYIVYVKLRNETQTAPSSTTSTLSSLAPLYEFRTIIADGDTWEAPFAFSFSEASHSENMLIIEKISVNDEVLAVSYPSIWDSENKGFFYQLFFELWIYDKSISGFTYHERFVGLWLNITV